MMFGPIRVAAVDDDPAHLLAITSGLAASGIPCAGYWYDGDSANLSPVPTAKLAHARLIFMDLNLAAIAGGPPETASLCATVMDVLDQLLSKDSGPYLLVFWTNVSTRVEEVAAELYKRLEVADNIPSPIAISHIGKGPFLVNDPKERDFKSSLTKFHADLHANLPALAAAVAEAVGIDTQLNLLCAWESRASMAAAGAVNEIFRYARSDAASTEQTGAIQRIAAKIAIAASGETSAKRAPARALDAGMIDILVDQFGASVDDRAYQGTVIASLDALLRSGDVKCNDDAKVTAALNTFFHVDSDIASTSAAERGVVIDAKLFNKGELGFKLHDQLNDFLIPATAFPPPRQLEATALWKSVTNQTEFVLIELGADCDHAQDTTRTRRFLLGLEVPMRLASLVHFPGNGKLRNGALELLGPWTINGAEKWLLVSCKRFWIWQDRAPHKNSKVKYRLRAPLIEKLLHRYASWHSRPGIVEFNSHAPGGTVVYFAYGSNMYSDRLKSLAPSASKLKAAIVKGYELAFDKVSTDGSGKCHMRKVDDQEVHGALYLVDAHEMAALDAQEGGYQRCEIMATTLDGECVATTYLAEITDATLKPYDWYVDYVAAGAEEHGVPAAYLAHIRATLYQEDADEERKAKHQAALKKPAAAA